MCIRDSNNSRLETEQEKTLGGQLDATESLFNEKDQKKLADEKRKQEKQLTDSDGQLFSAIKGKKKMCIRDRCSCNGYFDDCCHLE